MNSAANVSDPSAVDPSTTTNMLVELWNKALEENIRAIKYHYHWGNPLDGKLFAVTNFTHLPIELLRAQLRKRYGWELIAPITSYRDYELFSVQPTIIRRTFYRWLLAVKKGQLPPYPSDLRRMVGSYLFLE